MRFKEVVDAAAEGPVPLAVPGAETVGSVGCVASVSLLESTGVRVPGVAGREGNAEKGGRRSEVSDGEGGRGVGGRL